jgi:SAM-dependent methyltransferase
VRGYVDQYRFGVVSGWAYDPDAGRGAGVTILIDGTPVATLVASHHRGDLAAAGIGDGHCAFRFEVPDTFADGRPHELAVTFTATGHPLPNGAHQVAFEFTSRQVYAELLRHIVPRGLWSLDVAGVAEGTLALAGWIVPPYDLPTAVAVSVNGTFVPDLERRAVFMPRFGRDALRFAGRMRLADLAQGAADLRFRVHFGPLLVADESLAFALPLTAPPVPDAARQMRVQGLHNDHVFNRTGYTTALKLDGALARVRGRPFAPGDRVLDWGIGCGRVARFVAQRVGTGLTGADIDADNVAWCNANIPGVSAVAIRQDPPMPFADGSFDVLYGISVFTHLDEADEGAWLRELDRVLAPGGVALVTTHGETAWWLNQTLGPLAYADWKRSGLKVVGANPSLADVAIDQGRYLDTFTSRQRVADVWGRRFDVLDHVEGLIECNQDLVLLRSRKPLPG